MTSNESSSSYEEHALNEQRDFSDSFSDSDDISYISSPPVPPLDTTLPLYPSQNESTSETVISPTSPWIHNHSPLLDCLLPLLKTTSKLVNTWNALESVGSLEIDIKPVHHLLQIWKISQYTFAPNHLNQEPEIRKGTPTQRLHFKISHSANDAI
ncbi:hypothetical protein LOD99_9942 [Oopsacas minuta]|uniref:Uncharacterized protein n=1 Tax=Oopsacas minuta TaxID=111878 RepID=A0AAV7KLA5_9METZ|nr:hypothetical protein LOD99_9942 [Oopsacas minuta]